MNTRFLVSIVSITALFLFLTGCDDGKGKEERIIKVAANLPMTGYVGVYGEWLKRGIDMAKKDSQAKLDSLKIDVKFDFQDNKGDNRDAVNLYHRQLLNEPDIIFSGLTGQSMSIIDQVSVKGVPHFLFSFTPLTLEEGKRTFRTFPNFGIEATHYLNFIKNRRPKKIAFVYLDLVGTNTQINDVVIPELKKIDNSISIFNERYPISQENFKSISAKIKTFSPDVIIVNGYKDNLINIIKDFSSYKINTSNIILSMDFLDIKVGDIDNSLLEGLYTTAPTFLIPEKRDQKMLAWIKDYEEIFNTTPGYVEAYAYDMANIIFEAAIKSIQHNMPLTDALFSINLIGVTGTLNFARNGELYPNMYTVKYQNGNLIDAQ